MWFQVYGTEGKNDYRAQCKHIEEAAVLCAFLGKGAQIRAGKEVLWHEGHEDQPAAESYDHVADVAMKRLSKASTPKPKAEETPPAKE